MIAKQCFESFITILPVQLFAQKASLEIFQRQTPCDKQLFLLYGNRPINSLLYRRLVLFQPSNQNILVIFCIRECPTLIEIKSCQPVQGITDLRSPRQINGNALRINVLFGAFHHNKMAAFSLGDKTGRNPFILPGNSLGHKVTDPLKIVAIIIGPLVVLKPCLYIFAESFIVYFCFGFLCRGFCLALSWSLLRFLTFFWTRLCFFLCLVQAGKRTQSNFHQKLIRDTTNTTFATCRCPIAPSGQQCF